MESNHMRAFCIGLPGLDYCQDFNLREELIYAFFGQSKSAGIYTINLIQYITLDWHLSGSAFLQGKWLVNHYTHWYIISHISSLNHSISKGNPSLESWELTRNLTFGPDFAEKSVSCWKIEIPNEVLEITLLPRPIQRCSVTDNVKGFPFKNTVLFKSNAFTNSTTMIVNKFVCITYHT